MQERIEGSIQEIVILQWKPCKVGSVASKKGVTDMQQTLAVTFLALICILGAAAQNNGILQRSDNVYNMRAYILIVEWAPPLFML